MDALVLIEDDDKIRHYLSELISRSGLFRLEAAFPSAEAAIQFFESGNGANIALVLTDIQLPEKSGIDFISWLKPQCPHIQCLVLSAFDDADKVFKALKAGATGYVLKNTEALKLLDAINDVLRGGSPMSSQIARKVVMAFQKDVPYFDAKEKLSDRENEVLGWLAKGFSYQEIADKLFLSVETIRTHIRNIYEKLQVRNKKEAIKKAGLY